MHLSSSLAILVCAVLFSQYVRCIPSSPKTDEKWWFNLTGLAESRQRSQWTTLDTKSTKSPPKLTTNSNDKVFRKRSSFGVNDDNTDSPVRSRSRNWEKSYARRRDFDRTWKDDQPIRERFSQTEWDDDVPVRHVFRDSSSSIDEGPSRSRFGDESPRERMSRPWARGDWNDSPFSSRNTNKNNANNKPKVSSSSSQQPKSDRTDRLLNLNFNDEDAKRKDKERLSILAKQIFGDMEGENGSNGNNGNTRSNGNNGITITNGNGFNGNGRTTTTNGNGRTTTTNGIRTNGNGYSNTGYVSNAINSFTKSPGNSYVSATGSTNGNTNGNKQMSDRLVSTDLSRQSKPKWTIPKVETTPFKSSTPSQTTPAKPKANDIRLVADKPRTSTTPSSKVGFGWRSSLNHSNDQKNQKIQNSVEDTTTSDESPEDEEEDDFEEDLDDDLGGEATTPEPDRSIATTRTTLRPAFRTTLRPTTKSGVDYTTYRVPETTRPQTTPAIINRVTQTTTLTTSRPKPITTKTSTNALSPDKKQHRMGSWVDSDSLDYVEGEGDDSSDVEDQIPVGLAPDPPQPLVQEEFEEEQLPERVEEEIESPPIPVPMSLTDSQKFARQSSRSEGDDDQQEGWSLEDALPGVPGTDYPTFATIPRTNFDCRQHEWPGYYADVETQCQVFHICQTGGRKNSFLCPNGTMFNQLIFVCDWWHNVQCGDSVTHYGLNENIYDHNWESKRISSEDANVKRSGALTGNGESEADADSDESEESMDRRMDTDAAIDDDYADENLEEMNPRGGKAQLMQRERSPVRIYRTSRIITDPDRQKRRRRKRGHLNNSKN